MAEEDQGSGRILTQTAARISPPESRPCPSTTTVAGPSRPLDVSSFTHTPYYCEENVYLLCKRLCEIGVADPMGVDLFVVFISNEEKMIPLWCQKAGKGNDGFVVWDYHVICIQSTRGGNVLDLVWDLDSNLPFPFPLNEYFAEAICPMPLNFANSRLFRVVHAPIFLRCFASDRSHMKDTLGNWLALPPKYDPIVAEDGTTNNIDKYNQMNAADVLTDRGDLIQGVFSNKYGVLVGETMLEWFFSQIHW